MVRVGAVFAGGEGRRFGGIDKAQLEINGEPFWQHVVGQLQSRVEEVLLLSPVRPLWMDDATDLVWVPDASEGDGRSGPAGALLAALRYVKQYHGDDCVVLTCPVDAPFYAFDISDNLEKAVIETDVQVAIARTGQRLQPVFGAWRAGLANRISICLQRETSALHRISKECGAAIVEFEANDARFTNINTPEDLETARAVRGGLSAD